MAFKPWESRISKFEGISLVLLLPGILGMSKNCFYANLTHRGLQCHRGSTTLNPKAGECRPGVSKIFPPQSSLQGMQASLSFPLVFSGKEAFPCFSPFTKDSNFMWDINFSFCPRLTIKSQTPWFVRSSNTPRWPQLQFAGYSLVLVAISFWPLGFSFLSFELSWDI